MNLIKEHNTIAGFSDASDGDLSFYVMSDEKIVKTWKELPSIMDLNLPVPAFASQIHGDKIIDLKKPADFCAGAADALITALKNQPIGVFSADCLPLLIFNDAACAAVHAGWRGTRLDIARRTVETFFQNYGQSAGSLRVYVGPCIGQCCLEMGDEVYDDFVTADKDYAQFFERRGKWHLNLRALNRFQLLRAGVKSKNIIVQNDCTFCKEKDFFSFRRQRQRNGSMFSFVVNRDAD